MLPALLILNVQEGPGRLVEMEIRELESEEAREREEEYRLPN